MRLSSADKICSLISNLIIKLVWYCAYDRTIVVGRLVGLLPHHPPFLFAPPVHEKRGDHYILRSPRSQPPLTDGTAPIGLDVDVATELAKVLGKGLDHLILVGGCIDEPSAVLAVDKKYLVRHRLGPSRFPVIQLDDPSGLVVLVVVREDVVPDGESVPLARVGRRTVVVRGLLRVVDLFPFGEAALFELFAGTARTWLVPRWHPPSLGWHCLLLSSDTAWLPHSLSSLPLSYAHAEVQRASSGYDQLTGSDKILCAGNIMGIFCQKLKQYRLK